MSVNTDGYNRFLKALEPEMKKAADIAGLRVLTQWQRDFSRNSRGGGDWAPLTLETALRRRKAARQKLLDGKTLGKGGRGSIVVKNGREVYTTRTHAILVQTGLLRGSLQVGNTGNIFADITGEKLIGKRVGIGGDNTFAQKKNKAGKTVRSGSATLGQIARWHNDGAGNLPKRVIARPLTKETADAVNRAWQQALERAGKA